MTKKISVQEALDMLTLHNIIEKVQLPNKQIGYQVTDITVEKIKDNLYLAYQTNPKDSKESIKIQGLVLTVLDMGFVYEKDLPVFVDVIDRLMEPANSPVHNKSAIDGEKK